VLLKDADQNLIVGPSPYQGGSVLLSSSDAENGQLSKPRLISPADATGITVTYSGAAVAGITFAALNLTISHETAAVLTPTGAAPDHYRVLHRFTGMTTTDGSGPTGTMLNVNGTLYGTSGGAGGVFAVTTSGAEQMFSTASAPNPINAIPSGGLVDVNGTLYGIAARRKYLTLLFRLRSLLLVHDKRKLSPDLQVCGRRRWSAAGGPDSGKRRILRHDIKGRRLRCGDRVQSQRLGCRKRHL
jgi:hypothetical protein